MKLKGVKTCKTEGKQNQGMEQSVLIIYNICRGWIFVCLVFFV